MISEHGGYYIMDVLFTLFLILLLFIVNKGWRKKSLLSGPISRIVLYIV